MAETAPWWLLIGPLKNGEQDSQLLSGTVAENLRLARQDARVDELRAAMSVAVLAGHVGLTAQLGPGGEGLSGGQRRRLGVAQAYPRYLRRGGNRG
jgi:ATP-binding cassette, subfamily C, bacterial CydC